MIPFYTLNNFKSFTLYVALQLVSLTRTTQSHNFIRCLQIVTLDMHFSFSFLKLSFIFSYWSFFFKIVINYSWIIYMSINAWDINGSIPLSLILDNIIILSRFFFLFLVIFSNFVTIPVVRKKIRVKHAIPTGALIRLVNEIIDTALVVAFRTIKTLSM